MKRNSNRRIVLLGPPGAGKGTQGKLLGNALGLKHIASGDLVRHHQASKTRLGLESAEYYLKGLLVPDNITINIVLPSVLNTDSGFILDGFPRNTNQAQQLDEALYNISTSIDTALLISVPKEEMVKRLSNRRVCAQCSKVYHLRNAPPKVSGRCDICPGQLYQRDDDIPVTIETRINAYYDATHERVGPLADYYREQNKLIEVDGIGPVETIHHRILDIVRYANKMLADFKGTI